MKHIGPFREEYFTRNFDFRLKAPIHPPTPNKSSQKDKKHKKHKKPKKNKEIDSA